MEQISLKKAPAPPRLSGALRHWINWFLTQRRMSREVKQLANLPDHLLRDIGREDLIVPPINPGPYGH